MLGLEVRERFGKRVFDCLLPRVGLVGRHQTPVVAAARVHDAVLVERGVVSQPPAVLEGNLKISLKMKFNPTAAPRFVPNLGLGRSQKLGRNGFYSHFQDLHTH